jgi:hypothetical protein
MTVVEWLLDSDPSIRWQVMRDLTDEPDDVVAAERSRVASEGWGVRLLDLQAPDGQWGESTYSSWLDTPDGSWKGCWSTRAKGATAAVTEARARGQEYLLERRMFRSLSSGQVIDRDWTLFSFPTGWHYDVLRGLDYLRSAGVEPDDRIAEAIELVEKNRRRDRRWPLQNPHADQLDFDMEEGADEPSRWNTLRALRVLNWAGHGG